MLRTIPLAWLDTTASRLLSLAAGVLSTGYERRLYWYVEQAMAKTTSSLFFFLQV
jgi:hypothetical protein